MSIKKSKFELIGIVAVTAMLALSVACMNPSDGTTWNPPGANGGGGGGGGGSDLEEADFGAALIGSWEGGGATFTFSGNGSGSLETNPTISFTWVATETGLALTSGGQTVTANWALGLLGLVLYAVTGQGALFEAIIAANPEQGFFPAPGGPSGLNGVWRDPDYPDEPLILNNGVITFVDVEPDPFFGWGLTGTYTASGGNIEIRISHPLFILFDVPTMILRGTYSLSNGGNTLTLHFTYTNMPNDDDDDDGLNEDIVMHRQGRE